MRPGKLFRGTDVDPVFISGHDDPTLPIVLIDAQAIVSSKYIGGLETPIPLIAYRGVSQKICLSEIIADLKSA